MENWSQVYNPLGNIVLSALAAFVPILFFFLALTVLKMKGYIAALITVIIALIIAVIVYQMPVFMALSASVYGIFYGLWPVSYIIVAAIFVYKITIKTGQFDIIRSSIASLTEDQRLQVLLVGFSFGSFLEGAAGFGAPVAITAALLTGMGFRPLYAAGLCLIANTAPGAFGAMGIPILVAGKVTEFTPLEIGQVSVRQLPLLAILVPFLLVFILDGVRGWKETWPAILISGGTYAVAQFIIVNFIGAELADVTAAAVSLVALSFFLRAWKPKRIFRFNEKQKDAETYKKYSLREQTKAWSPFIILTIIVTIWSLNPFKNMFVPKGPLAFSVLQIPVPYLHNLVIKTIPIVSKPAPYEAILKLDIISATGTAILITAVISCFIFRFSAKSAVLLLKDVINELKIPILTICFVIAFAFVSNYSGMSSTLGLALASTGQLFPFFSPFLGWLGVFLTGSVMSNNALFANLQNVTANQIGINPTLLISANVVGGVTAKMISPQSIAVACAAVGLSGKESNLLRFTIKYSLMFTILVAILTFLQSRWLGWMLP